MIPILPVCIKKTECFHSFTPELGIEWSKDSYPVIVSFLAANPDWYLHQPNNSVLASQNSISQAVLNERDANIVNNSNVEELNLSSFDTRQINKILNSSVVVNKAEMEQLMKRYDD